MKALRHRSGVVIALLAVVVLLTLPLLIPVMLVWEAIRERKKRTVASSFACLKCGAILGAAAVRLANEVYKEEMRKLWEQKPPGVKWRLAPRTLHAICLACGTRYTYLEKERTFVIEEPWPPPCHTDGRSGDDRAAIRVLCQSVKSVAHPAAIAPR